MKLKVVVLDGYCLNPGDLSWSAFEELAEVEVWPRTDPGQVVERASAADAVLTNKTALPRETIERLERLRYIGVLATGYNVVDAAFARERGIVVTNIPTYGTDAVAQFAIALLLELCLHVGMHSESVRAGEWTRSPDWSYWKTPLIELAGLRMGVVGFGRIGRRVGEIARALNMKVAAHDEMASQIQPPFEAVGLDELLETSDVVSLHCPLTEKNRGMIGAAALARMKPSAFLLNTSRGPLVADRDLADALNAGRIAGAALDVLSVEPPAADNPLFRAKNCIITPHMAWAARAARERLMALAASNFRGWLKGNPVNRV